MFIIFFSWPQSKLKESQYQLAPWRSDVNHSNFASQSPSHSLGATLTTSVCSYIFFWLHFYTIMIFLNSYTLCQSKNGLELVSQPAYSQGKTQIISDAQTDSNWDLPGQHQGALGGGIASKNLEPADSGRYSPIASRWAWLNGECYY